MMNFLLTDTVPNRRYGVNEVNKSVFADLTGGVKTSRQRNSVQLCWLATDVVNTAKANERQSGAKRISRGEILYM